MVASDTRIAAASDRDAVIAGMDADDAPTMVMRRIVSRPVPEVLYPLPMALPLVDQLRFARHQFGVALAGTPEADGARRLEPMNSIGWIVAHLAWHEQAYWLTRAQGHTPRPELNDLGASGKPATTPSLAAMLDAWTTVTAAADAWLDSRTQDDLVQPIPNSPSPRLIGTSLLRVTYHYWFHAGEILAIRQVLGHAGLPEFVGDIDGLAPYRPDAG